jgi:hypothetical protein
MQEGDPRSDPSGPRVFVPQWNPLPAKVLESFVQTLDLEGNVMQGRTTPRDEPFHGTRSDRPQRLEGSLSHGEDAFEKSFAGCFMVAVQTQRTLELGFDVVRAIVCERDVM